MDKYRLQPKPKENQTENEIRVKASGIIWNYISYAATMLLEKNMQSIVFKGTGNAIPKIVILAELLRRRIANLHQDSRITNIETTDTYVPLEEGLDTITTTRRLTCLEIELSRTEGNTNSSGYQPPLPQNEVKELPLEQLRNVRRPSRGIRGGRGYSRGGQRGGRVYRGGARGGRSFRRGRGSFEDQGNTRGDFEEQRSRGRPYRGGDFGEQRSRGRPYRGGDFGEQRSRGRPYRGGDFGEQRSRGRPYRGGDFGEQRSRSRPYRGGNAPVRSFQQQQE